MNKLKLDDLSVETFVPSTPDSTDSGTVRGQATQLNTCNPTCWDLCDTAPTGLGEDCDYAGPDTSDYECTNVDECNDYGTVYQTSPGFNGCTDLQNPCSAY